METPFKFTLPSPNFDKNSKDLCNAKLHYLTPSGMSLLPREKQPPPMYGKRGPTLPPMYLKQHVEEQYELNAPASQYCEPCDVELNSLEDLKRHRAQHENCPVVGCHYKGHPSVMDKHVNALHASGLFDKFRRLSTPEEIAAWRDERRRRYPTLANVLLKQKAKEQRQKRGERLEASKSRFGNVNDKKRAQSNVEKDKEEKKDCDENTTFHTKSKRSRKNKHRNCKNHDLKPKVQNQEKQNDKNSAEEDTTTGIKMFGGTCQLKDYKHFNNRKNEVKKSVLYSLVGMYGSDEDESQEDDDDDNLNKTKETNNVAINNGHLDIYSEKLNEQLGNKEIQKDHKISLSNESNALCGANEDSFSKSTEADNTINTDSCPVIDKTTFISNELGIQDVAKENNNSCDEAPEETPIQRCYPDNPLMPIDNAAKLPIDKPETKCCKVAGKTPESTPKQRKLIKRKYGLDYRKARLRKQNTMLEKLLEMDIRHERNVLLQCVRYVCENNFFNIGLNKNQPNLEPKTL